MNIAKLTDWAMRLDHPPWTASKGHGKQRFRRILTPLDISCRCCPYRYNECHLSRYRFFGRVYPKVMPKRCILEDLCEGNGEILRTRCERRLRTRGERLMQYRNAYHGERFRKILESGKWEDRTMLTYCTAFCLNCLSCCFDFFDMMKSSLILIPLYHISRRISHFSLRWDYSSTSVLGKLERYTEEAEAKKRQGEMNKKPVIE